MKPTQRRFRLYIRKGSPGKWSQQQPDTVQDAFGQLSQGHGVMFGMFFTVPGAGLDVPDEPLPTQHFLLFCDSEFSRTGTVC